MKPVIHRGAQWKTRYPTPRFRTGFIQSRFAIYLYISRHLRPKNFSRVYGASTPAPGGLKLNIALIRLARPGSPVGDASTLVTRCMDIAPRNMTSEPARSCGTDLIAESGRGGGMVQLIGLSITNGYAESVRFGPAPFHRPMEEVSRN